MELGNGPHAAASAASFLNGMPDAYSPEVDIAMDTTIKLVAIGMAAILAGVIGDSLQLPYWMTAILGFIFAVTAAVVL
jgi:hypothetical protein